MKSFTEFTTLGDLLIKSADKFGSNPVIVFPEQRISYEELKQRSYRRAQALVAHDIGPGSHVGILMANCMEYIEYLFAAQLIGAMAVPINARYKAPELAYVLDDADIEKALPFLVNAAIQNAGQTCSAATRVLIEKPIFQELTERLAKEISSLRSGPALQDLECGPLISKVQKDRVEGFLQRARQDGVEFLAEGSIVEDAPQGGNYVAPCMVGSVPPKHTLAQDEVFGPLLVTMPFEGEEEGIELANNTVYGLVSGVWTKDGGRQLRVARRLKSGQVFINNYGAGGGVELPFGGVKLSGHGREKGFEALYGFSVTKTVAIHHGAS